MNIQFGFKYPTPNALFQTNNSIVPATSNTNTIVASYVGPEQGTFPVVPVPTTVMFIPVAPGQVNTFFAINPGNANTVPPLGTQDVLIQSAASNGVEWTIGSTANNLGNAVIPLLPVGLYDVSFSISVSNNTQSNVILIVALGTHTDPGVTFSVDGNPFTIVPNIYNIGASVQTEDSTESFSLSAHGLVLITVPTSNVGLVMLVDKDGDIAVSNINLVVTRIA